MVANIHTSDVNVGRSFQLNNLVQTIASMNLGHAGAIGEVLPKDSGVLDGCARWNGRHPATIRITGTLSPGVAGVRSFVADAVRAIAYNHRVPARNFPLRGFAGYIVPPQI